MSKPSDGLGLIATERFRQIDKLGYTKEHDAEEHTMGELLRAALCYANSARIDYAPPPENGMPPFDWPWGLEYWKPDGDPVRLLAKAGALIAAEIDRLQAAKARSGGTA